MKLRFIVSCAAVVLAVAPSLRAQISQPPPTPYWISSPENVTGPETHFRKEFSPGGTILKSVLLVSTKTNVVVTLNGVEIGRLLGSEGATSVELTKGIIPNTNILQLSVPGNAEVAALLEINRDVSGQRWIKSDDSWETARSPSGPWTGTRVRPMETNRNPFEASKIIDAYNSWKLALRSGAATGPADFIVAPGFKVELLRSALSEEGSWVAMTFDPAGPLTLARETKGLIRIDGASGQFTNQSEVIEDTLLECRGLLYAYDSLYVNANNSKGFFRLRDRDGDGRFDQTNCLLRTSGGVGHGRNRVVLGPDGAIWLVHGNDVQLPANIAPSSPLRNYLNDALLPAPFDKAMFDGGVTLPAGHILRTDKDGTYFELFAGGFRNPLDVAFDAEGEMFTFDADMEWDIGAPWYRPNRVNHVVSGADYGWRHGTMKWPDYLPDTLPSVVDIGLASPTAVEFGKNSAFPSRYKKALFIADWAYGRILAVHLQPRGAGFQGMSELFVSGRPLNVTDMTFGPDGALYFITGGRRTQSGLYRVTYVGAPIANPPSSDAETDQRKLRRKLESMHKPVASNAMDLIWRHLDDPDPWVRHAARVAMEHQPLASWREAALSAQGDKRLFAWLALGRSEGNGPEVAALLAEMDFALFTQEQLLTACRILEIICSRGAVLSARVKDKLREQFNKRFPADNWKLNHQLCKVLIYLQEPTVFEKTLSLVSRTDRAEDLLHYLFYLRLIPQPWGDNQVRQYFSAMRRAEAAQGGRDYYAVLQRVRDEVISRLPPEGQKLVGTFANEGQKVTAVTNVIRDWKVGDFDLREPSTGQSTADGKAAYTAAQCGVCHRFGEEGGTIGPDLTGVSSRFDRKAILESIIEPSKVIDEKFQLTTITLKSGDELTGGIEAEDEHIIVIRENPLTPEKRTIRKTDVKTRKPSLISPMPEGLINGLTRKQILDLLTYLGAR